MDNFRFDITSDRGLENALKVAFSEHSKASHWWSDERGGTPRLILAWTTPDPAVGAHPLPAPIDAAQAVDLIKTWLEKQEYGPEPDTDGHCGKAWRIYNDPWGHAGGYWQGMVAVEPVWATYGK